MYIRTKDGVYEVEKEECGFYCCKGLEMAIAPYDEEFINQSENLEELCDLVRFKTKDSVIHYIDLHKNKIEDIVVHFGGKNIIIDSFRYCIETDKGLIYVAKMDSDGKLVLI